LFICQIPAVFSQEISCQLIGSQYTYGNNKSKVQGFEQALTNEYAKHIGISKVVLSDGIEETSKHKRLRGHKVLYGKW
jgi:hypothetical protein